MSWALDDEIASDWDAPAIGTWIEVKNKFISGRES